MEKQQKSWPWALLALAIVLGTLYYQRATGPTWEKAFCFPLKKGIKGLYLQPVDNQKKQPPGLI